MSKPKLNIKEESSTQKTRSPPKKAKVEQSVPRKKKLKTDAEAFGFMSIGKRDGL